MKYTSFEYRCENCGYAWIINTKYGNIKCHKCGSSNFLRRRDVEINSLSLGKRIKLAVRLLLKKF